MTEKLVESLKLDGDLSLEIWDLSRPIAGDRWLVILEARLDVPLEIGYLESIPDREKAFSLLKDKFKGNIPYRYRQERHFVDKDRKGEVFEEFLGILRKNVLAYISRSEFAERLVLSKVREIGTGNPDLLAR
jgi:hypothetical protein